MPIKCETFLSRNGKEVISWTDEVSFLIFAINLLLFNGLYTLLFSWKI